jgi:hypothetical protein
MKPNNFKIGDIVVQPSRGNFWRIVDMKEIFWEKSQICDSRGDRYPYYTSQNIYPGDLRDVSVTLVVACTNKGKKLKGKTKSNEWASSLKLAKDFIGEERARLGMVEAVLSL